MSQLGSLLQALDGRFSDKLQKRTLSEINELTIEVASADLYEIMQTLATKDVFSFECLVDICGVDYLEYGKSEWSTDSAAVEGFSRGVEQDTMGFMRFGEGVSGTLDADTPRYASVYHLLSYKHNWRLRVRSFCENNHAPMMPSVENIWPVANWFEREAFDLFGILYEGHSDLRRILTDYGFVGHPLRKDFPLVGQVEMRYDEAEGRVVYEPVSIEPRVLVPRAIRKDNRFDISKEAAGE